MKRSVHLAIWMTVYSGLLAAVPVFACPCSGSPAIDDGPSLLAHYDAVFIAEVWAEEALQTEYEPEAIIVNGSVVGTSHPTRVSVLHPIEVWKGPENPLVFLLGGYNSCSVSFRVGERYLVFAQAAEPETLGETGPVLRTGSCNPNRLIDGAAELPDWLSELQSWRAPGFEGPGWLPNSKLQQNGGKPPAGE